MGFIDNLLKAAGYEKAQDKPVESLSIQTDQTAEHLHRVEELMKGALELTVGEEDFALPVRGGERSSVDDAANMGVANVLGLASLKPDFPLEWIGALEHLAIFNSDVSYALDNILNLANTPHKVYFDDSVADTARKEMNDFLTESSGKWYEFSGGINSLINDLIVQIATTGAISAEIIPNKYLDNIQRVVKISPKNIRFKQDPQTGAYKPYQKLNNMFALGQKSEGPDGLIELNTVTYKYIALKRAGQSPYAVPPFLSAVESLTVQRDQIDNFKNIMKKMGVLGFMTVLMKAPTKQQAESEQQFAARCARYLSDQIPEVQKAMSKGFVMGFKDTHEFNLTDASTNAEGAEILWNIQEKNTHAGLKQDPAMLGRSFTTSETFGRVILAKLTMQVINYQGIVASFLEELYMMALLLGGFAPGKVTVEFEKPMLGDALKDAEARALQVANTNNLVLAGVIDRQQQATELGYDKPALTDEDQAKAVKERTPVVTPAGAGGKNNDPTNTDPSKKTEANALDWYLDLGKALGKLRAGTKEYEYSSYECACGCGETVKESWNKFIVSLDTGDDTPEDPNLQAFIKGYVEAAGLIYDQAVEDMIATIAESLTAMGENATLTEVQDRVISDLFRGWGSKFTDPMRKEVNHWVEDIYKYYRTDAEVLAGLADAPVATFGLLDIRAIEYYKGSDNLYLGKFITDNDTVKAINAFIKEQYLGNNTPIGNNTKAINEFKLRFGNVLDKESWKIRRVIDTSVNRMRNEAAVNYMQQAGVQEFEVVGISSPQQCSYCASMQGFRFSVDKEVTKFNKTFEEGPESVEDNSPFITSLYKPKEFVDLVLEGKVTAKTLQMKGVGRPPYHPNCRDIVVAVIT